MRKENYDIPSWELTYPMDFKGTFEYYNKMIFLFPFGAICYFFGGELSAIFEDYSSDSVRGVFFPRR